MEAKYLHMSIEELVEDTDFAIAVRSKINPTKWSQWIQSQTAEVQEKIKKASAIVSSLSRDNKPHTMNMNSVEQLWSRIEKSTSEAVESPSTHKTRTIPMWAYVSSIAAAVALLIMLSTGNSDYTVINDTRDVIALTLPSDTKVSLKTESTVEYDEESWQTERNIKLDGRAFFDVTQGVPFNIETTEGSVHVLGTAFEVVEREGVFLVAVERGLVRVESGLDKEELGQGMTFLKNPTPADVKELKGETKTLVNFEGVKLSEAVQAIEFLYDIDIQGLRADGDRPFTGSFDSQNLEQALKDVLWLAELKYEISNSIVTVSK